VKVRVCQCKFPFLGRVRADCGTDGPVLTKGADYGANANVGSCTLIKMNSIFALGAEKIPC
jgi:hypothetical protein